MPTNGGVVAGVQAPRRIAVSDVEASPEGVVASWKLTTRFFPLPFNFTVGGIRAEHVANRRIVEKASIRTKDVDEFTFEPSGNGTRMTWHSEFSAPNPLLVKPANFLAAKGKSHERQLEDILAEVNRELETAPEPTKWLGSRRFPAINHD